MIRMMHEGATLRRALGLMVAAILFGSALPVLAEEPTATVGTETLKDLKVQALSERVTELELATAKLKAENQALRRTVTAQAKRINTLRSRYLSAVRRIRALVKRIASMFGPWRTAKASWYGPGFYGRGMAGGGILRPGMKIFAHKTMRFGTKVQFKYGGRTVVAVARDRGPYVAGREFDLGPGTAKALRFNGVGKVKWRIVKS